jgi:hypothetical protein
LRQNFTTAVVVKKSVYIVTRFTLTGALEGYDVAGLEGAVAN